MLLFLVMDELRTIDAAAQLALARESERLAQEPRQFFYKARKWSVNAVCGVVVVFKHSLARGLEEQSTE